MRIPSVTVIRDSREKMGQGWVWEPEERTPGKMQILGMEVKTLDAGDYTLQGYEGLVRIERKASFAELAGQLANKDGRERFERELEKLREIKHKYILIESVLHDEILGLGIPQFRQGPPMKRFSYMLTQYEMEYGVVWRAVGDAGKAMARQIFDTIIRRYPK